MEHFGEPGAVPHGNFINYYDFNSAEDRIKLLPSSLDIWNIPEESDSNGNPYLILDVGCNVGNFTQLLYGFLVERFPAQQIYILGIDIDPVLIRRANEANQHLKNVFYLCYNMMEYKVSNNDCIANFLKSYDKKRFDVVCCFSITMWIHLNNGDNGLKLFLESVANLSEILIIEPQPWKCYLSAVRRMKRANANSFSLFPTLKMRNNVESDIKDYLGIEKGLDISFESDPTKWKRKIYFFKK